MKTYQDLKNLGDNEQERMGFIIQVIEEHKATADFHLAVDATEYYNGGNPTISALEHIIYDAKGIAHRDVFSPNHKLKSGFFRFAVDQEVSYLLSNGITFTKSDTLDKLGPEFCERTCDMLTNAAKQGRAYGFWNYDHVEVFQEADTPGQPGFVPLWDDTDGLLKAGIRYWTLDGGTLRATLYELDGITDYIRLKDKPMEVKQEKRTYITVRRSATLTEDAMETPGRNYDTFPIVPMQYSDDGKSAIYGKRGTIDALDLTESKMVNNVDQGNLIFWIIKNCGGMDGEYDAQKLYEIITSKVLHVNEGEDVEPHSIEAPFEGNKTTEEMLLRKLHQDFQTFNSDDITANQTATAIKAAYGRLDLKADKTERRVTEWINGILAVAGIDDKPSYTRSPISNKAEEVQTVLSAAEYLDSEYMTRKILTILGDADQVEAVMRRRAAEEADRYKQMEGTMKQEGGLEE